MRIYIGADHAGVALKKKIVNFLKKKKIPYEDLGGFDEKSKDDYPDYAFKVSRKVANEKDARGILICGTGTGMVMAANKIKGIRAAVAYDKYSARKSREDNNANIICLRGRKFSPEMAKKVVNIWLNTRFSNKGRHKRRLRKLE